jgi:hypothetical protein
MTALWPAPAAPIERVLRLAQAFISEAAANAAEALEPVVASIASSDWPDVAWRFSTINSDGYPVEFTFSSTGPAVQYTAEIAGPEMDERTRFRHAMAWAGVAALPDWTATAVWKRQAGRLAWGAWVGGHCSESETRRKIYVEATPAFQAPDFVLPANARLQFAGIVQGGRYCEFYFRRNLLEVADVGRVLCGLRFRDCFDPIVHAVASTIPWPVHDRLLPTDSGFSIAPGRAFSIYTYARSLWGSDSSIRRHLLDLAAKNGWDLRLYEAVSAPLDSKTSYSTAHSILAWIVSPGRPVEVRITMRPPA